MNNDIRTIIVLMIVVLLLSMSIPGNTSSESQSYSTDVDFYAGILENTEVVGTGTDAYIRLGLTEDGSYAKGFDNDGANSTNPSSGSDYARSVAVDSNYVYVAGYDNSPGNYQWRIEKRDKITGALVTAFDTDGVVESNPSTGSDLLFSIAVDSSYIYLGGSDSTKTNYQWRIEKRDKTTGALVTAFDTDGVVESNPSSSGDGIYSITVDTSYIYSAGYDRSAGDIQWRVEKRDKTTGALVTAFDTDGVVENNPSGNTDVANSITVDSNNIYVAGYDASPGNFQWRVEKRDKTTGALVTAFDTDGVVESDPSTSTEYAYSIADDSSYIYVAGFDSTNVNGQLRVEKRDKTTGALVTAFDTDGVVESNPSGSSDYAYSIAVDVSYIYVAGYDLSPGNYQLRVEKRDKTTGAIITAFDTDGVVESNPSSGADYAYSIAIDSSNIYVAGIDRIPGNYQWRLEKRDITTGANASGFDTDGVVESDPSSGQDNAYTIAVDSDYMYIGGLDSAAADIQWRLEKRDKATGSLVTAFDTDGAVQNNPSTGNDNIKSIAIDSDYIYASGVDYSQTDPQWRVEKRLKTTGALVTAFDTDGVVESNPSSSDDQSEAIIVDSNYIYVAGYDASQVTNYQWRIEKRDKTTGALVSAFDSDGVVESNPTTSTDGATAIAMDSAFLYVAGYDDTPTNAEWRIEKRDKTTGALVTEFDTDGIVLSNPSSDADFPYAISVDSSHIYTAGFDRNLTDYQWRIEKRDKTTGALVTAFDDDGVVTNNPSSSNDFITSMEVDSNYIYLGGYDSSVGGNQWRLEKRDKVTGELVTSFDTDGVLVSNPSSSFDRLQSVALDSGYIYAAGFDVSTGGYQWRVEKYNNHVYKEHGTFISPIIEASGTDNVLWTTISWTSYVRPSDTMIQFRLASCDDGAYWGYVGPDGTEDTYYETASGQAIWSGHSGRYMRYKAYFTTDEPGSTPTLSDVNIAYTEYKLPEVEVRSPNGGEDWMKDDFYPITWNAEGSLNSTPVQLSYSTDNGGSWTDIANWIANTGYYNWTVPSVDTPSALIRINVTDIYGNTASDTSDASFAIDPPPVSFTPADGLDPDQTSPSSDDKDIDNNIDPSTSPDSSDDRSRDQTDKLYRIGFVSIAVILIISIALNMFLVKSRKRPIENNGKQIPGKMKDLGRDREHGERGNLVSNRIKKEDIRKTSPAQLGGMRNNFSKR